MQHAAIDHLTREHLEIRRHLDAVETYASLLAEPGDAPAVDARHLWPTLDYLTEVLLLRHEEKEETVLLPALHQLGFSWNDGPLAGVRREHRQGRYLASALRQVVHQRAAWTRDDRRHFVALAQEWIGFIRHHMALEESVLFTAYSERASAELDVSLCARFVVIDREVDELPGALDLGAQSRRFADRQLEATSSG